MNALHIRPWTPADNPRLLHLLRLLTPAFFAPEEEADFVEYLAHHRWQYFVAEKAGEILACGGLNPDPEHAGVMRISWDMVHPAAHGQGIGTALLEHRIAVTRSLPEFHTLRVRTSQQAQGFYARAGFMHQETVPDYWAPGFDMVRMEMPV